jgi:hypothetical protein
MTTTGRDYPDLIGEAVGDGEFVATAHRFQVQAVRAR